MSNKDYYQRWLEYKKQLKVTIQDDERIQSLAKGLVGIKPQATAIETVARTYCKFCNLYNKLCDVYDQMQQPQRQDYIKTIIDAITCRIMELKATMENIEVFEYTYTDNAMVQMLIIPEDVQILCPFFYPFETRRQELQYIVNEILAGNRLGDPTPTPSEIVRREEERLEQERIEQEEKNAEIQRKLAMGEDIIESEPSIVYTPEQLETMRQEAIYNKAVSDIQRMERARYVIFNKCQKAIKDINLYLDLAGLRKPKAREPMRIRAASFIQKFYRRFMMLKREHIKENQLKLKLEMIMPSQQPISAKIQLKKVQEVRRNFRRAYYQKWLDQNVKEKSRILRWKEGAIMEDISEEIRQWFRDWYKNCKAFDEFPFPGEDGSVLIVKGETFTIDEYWEWRKVEERRLKMEASNPKTPEDIKAEKLAEKEEKKRLALEAKEREKLRIMNYKKMRLNPDSDPGVYIDIGDNVEAVQNAWYIYENQWKTIDIPQPALEVIKGHILNLILENKYHEVQLELRPIVDEMMRIELQLLKAALKIDYDFMELKLPITQKRKKPKKPKVTKPEKTPPAVLFQQAVDVGLVVKYPHTTLDDYWGDRNYAEADNRAILWTPKFTIPCLGDVQEQVRVRCLMALGADCPKVTRSQLIVGPKYSGKRTLAYAVATETNSILIDLSPMNVYNYVTAGKSIKLLYTLVNKVSRIMQPTVILVNGADKMFYKKVPPEEKMYDPTRLSKDFFKEVVKGLRPIDKVMVIGTASEPWLAKPALMKKAFPSVILLPKSDFGSISYLLTRILMKYHGISRDFDVHSLAQVLRGCDLKSIKEAIDTVLNGKRIAELKYRPLDPTEIANAVIDNDDTVFTDDFDYDMFKTWYSSYSPFGVKEEEYMFMLETQLTQKLKADKEKKKK